MKRLLVIYIIVLLYATAVEAKTLYVDISHSSASDSYSHTQNDVTHPWATLGRAVWGSTNRNAPNSSEAAQAGDTVNVAAGTYTAPDTGTRFDVAFNPVNSGTSDSNRIIIQAVGTVNLSTTGSRGGPVFGSNGEDYITWDGFTVDETSYTSLNSGEQTIAMVIGANYVNIKNCTLKGRTIAGRDLNHAAIFYHGVVGGEIYNNTIYDSRGAGSNNSAIYFYGASDVTAENNTIYNSTAGIYVKAYYNDNIIIKENLIYGMTYWGIRIGSNADSNTNILVYQNIIYDVNMGVMSYTNVGAGCKVVNNTIYDSNLGFQYAGETSEILWYNNIVHTMSESAVGTESYTQPPTYHDFQHNSYYGIPGSFWRLDHLGSSQTFSYWTGTWGMDGDSPAAANGTDPLLANIAGNDFRLCTASGVPHASCSGASPALNLGVDILDLDGDSSTTDLINRGAYITGSEQIGVSQSSELSAPTIINMQQIR